MSNCVRSRWLSEPRETASVDDELSAAYGRTVKYPRKKRTWNIAMYRKRIKYPKYKEPIEPKLRIIGWERRNR